MKAAQVVAAHFTVGTDLNPLNAEQYARDSFSLVDEKASELTSVENRYRVTDKLVQDMIRLARKERPDMFLLGAGSIIVRTGRILRGAMGCCGSLCFAIR